MRIYASAALGHREPGRSDIKELILDANKAASAGAESRGVNIRPEKMVDIEIGYEYAADNLALSANIYLMEYWDMLLETGKLSDVGYAIKENVPRRWRRGIEISANWKPLEWLQVGGNMTLSTNKIREYTAYYEMYDNMNDWNYLGQHKVDFENTDILMSPSVVGMATMTFRPFASSSGSLKSAYATLNGKYVGRQYYDNTSSEERSVPAYFIADISLGYEIPIRSRFENIEASCLNLSFHIHNIFNRLYFADAWIWRAYFKEDDKYYSDTGIYPQAPLNCMFRLAYRF